MIQKLKYGDRLNPNNIATYNIEGNDATFFGNKNSSMEVKFNRVALIASRYEQILGVVNNLVLNNKSVPTSKIYNLSTSFLLILKTGIRIGNESSAEGFLASSKVKGQIVYAKTYGLTTLLQEHLKIKDGTVYLDFTGKKHVENTFTLSKVLSKHVMDIIYSNYTPVFNIKESELTNFIKDVSSHYFSSKDFRTFRANVYANEVAKTIDKPTDKKQWREAVLKVCEYVAERLNNTPAVCKTSYIDPLLFIHYFGEKESF